MNLGHFYYITEQYFQDFPDPYLMTNGERINGEIRDRPCFYAFKEAKTGLFWTIPISSQVEKYRVHYKKKIAKYGKCDTIVFGKIMGHEKAFLIQNMCPIAEKYVNNEYVDQRAGVPVRIDGLLEKEISKKASKVLALHRRGVKLIFPAVFEIEQKLLDVVEA